LKNQICILGAGITGLATGVASGLPVYEANEAPGGICSSYYMRPLESNRLQSTQEDGECYRFELGGGHWIWGGDPVVLHFVRGLVAMRRYERLSSVFFPNQNLYVPYPLQNYVSHLGKDIAAKALMEITLSHEGKPSTMAEELERNFGSTLTKLFFGPFHQLYTAGLWTRIAPQDPYKSPVNKNLVIQGAFSQTPLVGYNTSFLYPIDGLNTLAQRMAKRCDVKYSKQVVQIDTKRRQVYFSDGSGVSYEAVISTLPLNTMVDITGLEVGGEVDPYTSVLVLNIGGVRGSGCPKDHWIYLPKTKSGFHRVGFYSNVDSAFLPASSRRTDERVSIYVERAFMGREKPTEDEVKSYASSAVEELQSWKFIDKVEVIDPTWIEVAYTWSWPGSRWRDRAINTLQKQNVFQAGRYGRWICQGIADSIREGLFVGPAIKATGRITT
jgi:protoporphyrinogen oxidase